MKGAGAAPAPAGLATTSHVSVAFRGARRKCHGIEELIDILRRTGAGSRTRQPLVERKGTRSLDRVADPGQPSRQFALGRPKRAEEHRTGSASGVRRQSGIVGTVCGIGGIGGVGRIGGISGVGRIRRVVREAGLEWSHRFPLVATSSRIPAGSRTLPMWPASSS